VTAITITRGDDTAVPGATTGRLKNAEIFYNHNATIVNSGADTVNVPVGAIAATVRNGKTNTIRSVAITQTAIRRTSAGVDTELGGTPTLVAGVVKVAPLLASDWATAAGIAATDVLVRPYGVTVSYSEA